MQEVNKKRKVFLIEVKNTCVTCLKLSLKNDYDCWNGEDRKEAGRYNIIFSQTYFHDKEVMDKTQTNKRICEKRPQL